MSRKLMCIRSVVRWAGLVAVVAVTASCGDVVRTGRGPVMLTVNSLTADGGNTLNSDVVLNTGVVEGDLGTATLGVVPKDFLAPTTTNNDVTITRYRVEYRRADGRNVPGVDVPFPFDGAATETITAGSTGDVIFELVRHVAKKEAPLVQLVSDVNAISTIAAVTFYGRDRVGNELSATGSMLINFLNIRD